MPSIFVTHQGHFGNPDTQTEYVEVVLVSDDDGHDYLIPKELKEKFDDLNEKRHDINYQDPDDIEEQYDIWNQFDNLFNDYRMEGSQPSLYAKMGYQKEL